MTALVIAVHRPIGGESHVHVNVYLDGHTSPSIEDVELPFGVLPHEPQLGEQFTLVVA